MRGSRARSGAVGSPRSARVGFGAQPRVSNDGPFLSDHRDRLRQQPAPSGHRVREGDRGRHRAIPASLRSVDPLPDGQRRALAERLSASLEQGLEPRVFCDQMEQVFRGVWATLNVSFDDFIRTTEERHRVAVTTLVQRDRRCRRSVRRGIRGLVLRVVRGVQAGQGSGRWRLFDPSHQAGVDQGEEPFLPLVELSRPAPPTLRREPDVSAAGRAAQRDAASAGGGPRGHLDQPDRPELGHPTSVRSVECGLCVVRRPHQLHRRRGLWRGRRAFPHVVAGRLACGGQGHHAVPCGRVGRRCS